MEKFKLIPLTKGLTAKVSPEDFEFLSKQKWHACFGSKNYSKVYARKYTKKGNARMHRVVYERVFGKIPRGMVINHINNDSLDNRRENLELCTQHQNMCYCPNWKRKAA